MFIAKVEKNIILNILRLIEFTMIIKGNNDSLLVIKTLK